MINEKEFRTMKLNTYRNIVLSAGVEEDFDDIHIAIKYVDHRDDYLFIETKDGKRLMYGFFCNLSYHTDVEDLKPVEDGKDGFLRNPVMFVADMDRHAKVSNQLHHELELQFAESHMSFGYDRKCFSKESAQHCFERGLEAFERAFRTNSFYDYSNKYGDIVFFLINNDIATDENLELLKNAHLSSKIDGIDGIAGKKKWEPYDNSLIGDRVTFAMVDGIELNIDKLLYYTCKDYDKWGCPDKVLPLDQFDKDYESKCKSKIKDRINYLKEKLIAIENGIDTYSLIDLNELRYCLNEEVDFEYWDENESSTGDR